MSIADRIKQALQTGRRVAPSERDPWHGTPVGGSLWTREQHATLRREGRNPDTVKSCTVGVQVQNRANWAMPPETRRILVPMLARTANGRRALIVAPAGDKLWKDVL